tara:strand:+ start:318 stop:704 length:387 start_codon:yes stop_codon:yes gene_type:complete
LKFHLFQNKFNSKGSLITEKTQNLASLQEELNPLNNKMNELEGQRAEKNVVQLVQNGDGSISVIVGRTGVNVTGNQKVVYTGLTDAAANQGWGCDNSGAAAESACAEHRKAISEAEEASGLKVNAGQR